MGRDTVDGDIAAKDCLSRYKGKGGRVLAVASIYRDLAQAGLRPPPWNGSRQGRCE